MWWQLLQCSQELQLQHTIIQRDSWPQLQHNYAYIDFFNAMLCTKRVSWFKLGVQTSCFLGVWFVGLSKAQTIES